MSIYLSDKLRLKTIGVYLHMCPGCNTEHEIDAYNDDSYYWYFNGNIEYPTFEPKVRIHVNAILVCEYELVKGMIMFKNTCLHSLANKTMELPIYKNYET